ncbi:MAG: DUF2157 domain-containing protein [Chitinophagales bacterium]|nr:DUF2157 domain-containing protein [Chitinophagales bacterium]
MSIEKDLNILQEKGVISAEVGNDIRAYYKSKSKANPNIAFILFSIIGAVLIGLGVILLVAHNWDNMPRWLQTFIAFSIVILGQVLSIYGFVKNTVWREAAIAFLIIAIGACIGLIGQIYNVLGDENQFYFTWTMLVLPIVFLLKSQMAMIATLILSIVFLFASSRNDDVIYPSFLFWPIFGSILWYYWQDCKANAGKLFNRGVIYLFIISLLLALIKFNADGDAEYFISLSYFMLFQLFFILSNNVLIENHLKITFPLRWIGLLGMNLVMLILVLNDFIYQKDASFFETLNNRAFFMAIIITLLSSIFLLKQKSGAYLLQFYNYLFIAFLPLFLLNYFTGIGYLLMNIYVIVVVLFIIYQGVNNNSLFVTNMGLLMISVIIFYRFLDTGQSFFLRGFVFILTGVCFLALNLYILKRKKSHEA